ncbi:MAG: rod-binding protein [Candidatus Eremiobacteraeota bacterium]|nr:rod-binding protein [Candidatus Eremiobacteraeota bacterium]
MQIEGFNPEPLRQASDKTPGRAKEEAKLKDACQQFEQMYLQQMFTQMRKASKMGGGESLMGNSQGEEMFTGMLDQERAKTWSQEGGVGLANLLFQQMKKTL